MKLNIVRNILLSSAIALALCAGPTMAVASTAPHPVTAAPIIALSGVTSTVVDYTIHHIHTLDHNIHGKGTFRLTRGRGNVEAWTVHQLSTGRSYSTGYSIVVTKAPDGAQTISFRASVPGPSQIAANIGKLKAPSLLDIQGEKTANLSAGPVTIPCGSGISVTLSEKGASTHSLGGLL